MEILETCLQELDKGRNVESILTAYPEKSNQLRPLLTAAQRAREISVPDPGPEVIRRGRAKVMQHAMELRERQPVANKRAIPMVQRLAFSFVVAALLVVSGTGLVRASSYSLPGENLYSVKRSWEGLRLLLALDEDIRSDLEFEFENERLEEVSELISEGRTETIQFAGVFMEVNGMPYVSGVPILITENTQLPDQVVEVGSSVIVLGHTNKQGIVEVEKLELLPQGTIVPVGSPVEVEDKLDGEGNANDAEGSEIDSKVDNGFDDNVNSHGNGNDNNENENLNENNSNGNGSNSGSSHSGGGDDDDGDSGSGGGGDDDDDD
ncbi:MAG: hypothetical protein FJZ87_13890 [Chloroflexi bacterium]|nr:hypothetical protein [Chloroflexota bacterium]